MPGLKFFNNFWPFWQLQRLSWRLVTYDWLQLWQLRTWIHDNNCYLTIRSDSGQHSQFLRYLVFGKVACSHFMYTVQVCPARKLSKKHSHKSASDSHHWGPSALQHRPKKSGWAGNLSEGVILSQEISERSILSQEISEGSILSKEISLKDLYFHRKYWKAGYIMWNYSLLHFTKKTS